ncbi:uncharacterized protein RSE6_14866 [Rhynchosporium secalis]|uniref:RRM domain-containing protein n=1 Tax=Rhynchosporium secalis TaxID=38038 RepID=A0A1E1MWA5_RHYSE|nr:uncharacterized protein RSE6_14866 [Rhynchosporium secalis]
MAGNTTDKKLEDFARSQQPDGSGLAIIHAYVYPGQTSTSGWVSVRGFQDFRKAVHHMNHSAMEDSPRASRTLQADGRNEEKPVMLGESFPATPSSPRSNKQQIPSWQPPTLYTQSANPHDWHIDWPLQLTPVSCSTPMSSAFSDISYHQERSPHQIPLQNSGGFAPHYDYLRCAQPGIILSQMLSPSSPNTPIPQHVYVFPVAQQHKPMLQLFTPHPPHMVAINQPQTFMFPPPTSTCSSSRVTRPEARRIIITGLPPTSTEKDLQELIQSASSTVTPTLGTVPNPSQGLRTHDGPDGTRHYLQHLELVRHVNGTPKGHAFAVLESYATAKSTIDALNGIRWRGRRLRARFAKEGVESRNRGVRQDRRSEAVFNRWQMEFEARASGAASDSGEKYDLRSMSQGPLYQYTGKDNATECHYPVAQFSNIQTDYRDDSASYSSSLASQSKREENMSSVSSLSFEGDEEILDIVTEDVRSPTPVVVDGSSFGKMRR